MTADRSLPQPVAAGHRFAGAGDDVALWTNAAWRSGAAPKLSVLVPFRNDDCEPLVASLLGAVEKLGADVELVAADDGADEPAVRRRLRLRLADNRVPGAILIAARNLGRSAIRNRLAGIARAEHLLFIDAGMEVPGPHYLEAYLDMCERGDAWFVVGGYAVTKAALRGADGLAAHEFRHDQSRPAAARRRRPWKYVYAGNLLVHRRVAAAFPFDEGFRGWGWEDIEIGIRVTRSFPIEHVDNPVFRTTLSSAPEICRSFEESAPNFARIAALHPSEVAQLAIFRAARIAARIRDRTLLRRGLRWLALRDGSLVPRSVRLLALKLFRACIYADSLAQRTRDHRADGGGRRP